MDLLNDWSYIGFQEENKSKQNVILSFQINCNFNWDNNKKKKNFKSIERMSIQLNPFNLINLVLKILIIYNVVFPAMTANFG